ncbi:MAG: LPS export ABC transporter periplasmic protein LptC [Alphaproteobacteria bacterium]|nr:LPS export ABC transporter periplasmic protein LptC [Alphaproteobacteria bacterium]
MSMVERDPSRPGYDWSARVRTTSLEAVRYSRFVALMKRLLSLGAFLIIAAVLAFFFVQRLPRQIQMSYERLGHVENDLAMMKPRLTGADSKGNPYVITADMAVQDAHDSKKATLKNLEADLALDSKNWLNARARTGMVDMASGQLELTGGIDVFTATGYELHTSSASANLKQSMIHGHEPVTGQGPDGTLRADEFHADRATNILTLSGHVQMSLFGTRK